MSPPPGCTAGHVGPPVSNPVLICCALGFQRSALVATCYLMRAGFAENAVAAEAQIKAAGRPVHLPFEAYAAIEEAAR